MKRSSKLLLTLIVLMLPVIAAAVFSSSTSAQKPRLVQARAECEAQGLDCGIGLVVGKRGFYVPTQVEGCDNSQPQGCKFPATITGISSFFNPSTGRFQTVRDAQGHVLVSVHIQRPAFKGGSFDKDNVPFTEGVPGSFRTVQPGDLVGF
jgi:hypothetical protein